MPRRVIRLRGVAVHNLKHIDLDLEHGKLFVVCGRSGSGKTSLAIDTLYAEGQRRYIESFSAYSRQFLQRLEKPDAERIDGIPPAIAVTRKHAARSGRSTVGTATEILDHLRLLYARIGRIVCYGCGQPVVRNSPQQLAARLLSLPDGTRLMIAFPLTVEAKDDASDVAAQLREAGFLRVVGGDWVFRLDEANTATAFDPSSEQMWQVIVDRLKVGSVAQERLVDSLETAFLHGKGEVVVLAAGADAEIQRIIASASERMIDSKPWLTAGFSRELRCVNCGIDYPTPEPRLLSFNSPLGACPACEGFGNVMEIDMDLVVPDRTKSLREGAIAPWNTPAYAHELEELIALAPKYGLPVDVPFDELDDEHLRIIHEGVPEENFGGLRGFFRWLERRKYKVQTRTFLSRWRSSRPCPNCGGDRLRPEALAVRIGGRSIAELSRMQAAAAHRFLAELDWNEWERTVGRAMFDQATARLGYLCDVGLEYLTLDRALRSLSGGEAQRVALTSALGSSLVNTLYVLDEPSVGLHPREIDRLVQTVIALRDRGNTVVVVEHEEAIIRAADEVIEIGPGAGDDGGRVVFQGTPAELEHDETSLTGAYIARRRGAASAQQPRPPDRGRILLRGARGHNLKNIDVEFPLGLLCVVTGVSGSGKSTLVEETLYPALARRMRKKAPQPLEHDEVLGEGQLDDVVLVDQSPIGRSARSNPATYSKAFDGIRAVFAETLEARTRNFTAGHFSFNVDGGRCTACEGEGVRQIDMQFLADVYVKCPQCGGRRFKKEVLAATHRGKSIADVLEMTVREAFTFFRGHPKVQTKLKPLIDVGLDYLRLGQSATTLSGGESQRLKLAAYLTSAKRGRVLFLLDEPTTGLHMADVVQLLDCFDALLAVGHSLIVVEHNQQVVRAADYQIELGPGAAEQGGEVVAAGTPAAHHEAAPR